LLIIAASCQNLEAALSAALSSAELEVKAPLDFMSVLSPDAMVVFMGSMRNNE
jgi:hypothetical protein